MLEYIAAFIGSIKESLQFWWIIDQYERGVLLRNGKYKRTLKPGIYWKLPIVDSILSDNVALETASLNSQSLTSKDGQAIVVSSILTWHIKNIKKYLIDIEDGESVLSDTVYGIIGEYVQKSDWIDINKQAFQQEIHDEIKTKARKYGIEVLSLRFADLTKTKTIRLLNE